MTLSEIRKTLATVGRTNNPTLAVNICKAIIKQGLEIKEKH